MQPEGQSFWWLCGKEGNSVAVAEMQVVEIHFVRVVVQVLGFDVVFVFAAVAAAPHYSSPSPKAERSKVEMVRNRTVAVARASASKEKMKV